ncbi:hypothetical protein DFJ63DRAFT_333419 [Scheffersomyces coipomensis]|uniref:uncharacterized protein n=1 Tax=Scheffersomyces coipomensis TaxID=1788519 RepID=UPI00315D2BA7
MFKHVVNSSIRYVLPIRSITFHNATNIIPFHHKSIAIRCLHYSSPLFNALKSEIESETKEEEEEDDDDDDELKNNISKFEKNKRSPMKSLDEFTNDFTSVYTKYGWFAVPIKLYGYGWTVPKIEEVIESTFNQPESKDIAELTGVVNEWLYSLRGRDVPKIKKLTKRELLEIKENETYRRQLSGDIDVEIEEDVETPEEIPESSSSAESSTESSTPTPTPKKKVKKMINFTHAWNYFFSLKYAESEMDYKLAKKEIAILWKSFNLDEKNKYRQEYADLLKSGKDVYKGQIIDLAEKQIVNKTLSTYKRTHFRKKKLKEEMRKEALEAGLAEGEEQVQPDDTTIDEK